jgi:hypothetical protein
MKSIDQLYAVTELIKAIPASAESVDLTKTEPTTQRCVGFHTFFGSGAEVRYRYVVTPKVGC